MSEPVKRYYRSGRAYWDHTRCDHPATIKGREDCRRKYGRAQDAPDDDGCGCLRK